MDPRYSPQRRRDAEKKRPDLFSLRLRASAVKSFFPGTARSFRVSLSILLVGCFLFGCPTKKPAEPAAAMAEPAATVEEVSPAPELPPEPPPEPERPIASLRASKAGPSARPGEPVLVALDGPIEQLASVSAALGNTVAPVLPGPDGAWSGMVPVNRDHAPGDATVKIIFTYLNGSTTGAELPLMVRPRKYPSSRLTVAPEMARTPRDKLQQVEEDRAAFAAVWAEPDPERVWTGRFVLPTKGRVSSTFGERRVFNGDVQSRHSGIDIAAPEGAAVRASNAGRVRLVRAAYVEGLTVVIDHGGGVFTFYCHLSKARVKEGDLVEQGQRIGDVGMTGRATGPHLHWGARVSGERVDGLALVGLTPPEVRS